MLCDVQEELKELGREMDGFRWCPERPNGTTLIDQNWGYCGLSIGEPGGREPQGLRIVCGWPQQLWADAGAALQHRWECFGLSGVPGPQFMALSIPGCAGDTIVLELSTADTSEQAGKWATLYLGYLRSYEGMGLAKVACGGGCSCEETLVDAQWEQQASLTHMHDLKASLLLGVGWLLWAAGRPGCARPCAAPADASNRPGALLACLQAS